LKVKIDSARFHRVYPNLPMIERTNVCCVIGGEPFSWHIAYLEIKHNTKLGGKILEKMAQMKII